VPIYEKQGFEADDVVGTIVDKVDNIEIFIVSGDKDIFQLIDGRTKVYNLKKGLSQTQIVDSKVIEEEYSLQPKDFIDLKALAGDPSDNIPGVPGIGLKTATVLLQQYDTLENLYKIINENAIENIKPRILKLLKDNKEQAFLSQRLATIRKDVPIDFDIEKCRWGEYDKVKLKELFEELGFQSLLRRFGVQNQIEQKVDKKEQQLNKNDQLKLL